MKKFIIALLTLVLIAAPAAAVEHKLGIKTGGFISSDDLGVPGAENKSFSSPTSDQMFPPMEVEYNIKPDIDWISVSALIGTFAGKYEVGDYNYVETRSVYAMLMPRLEMQTSLGTVFSWIPGISKEDPPPPAPGEVIDDIPPVLDTDRDFDPEKRVKAYVGVGIGGAWDYFAEFSTDTGEFLGTFAPSVGAAWAFNEQLEMTFDYRYIQMFAGDIANPKGHLFLVGLAYTF